MEGWVLRPLTAVRRFRKKSFSTLRIPQPQHQQIQRAAQLDLPMVVGEPVPIVYVQMDGTGVPVVKKETAKEFGKRLYLEAWKRGWSRARKKVVIGDGAK
jgi:hypothetical protein